MRYMLKFSKGGKIGEDADPNLGLDDDDVDAAQDGGYYARYGEATGHKAAAPSAIA